MPVPGWSCPPLSRTERRRSQLPNGAQNRRSALHLTSGLAFSVPAHNCRSVRLLRELCGTPVRCRHAIGAIEPCSSLPTRPSTEPFETDLAQLLML
jgi:hypothetical protein